MIDIVIIWYYYKVDGCGKEFSAMGPLTSHLKSHSCERPHGCTVEGCGKRFTKASKLKLHLRTHTGERPFACDAEVCIVIIARFSIIIYKMVCTSEYGYDHHSGIKQFMQFEVYQLCLKHDNFVAAF